MKLDTYRIQAPAVTGYGPGWVEIDGQRYESGIAVRASGAVAAWGAAFEALTAADFAALAQDRPDVVVFGSGARLRFPDAALLRPLIEQGIGLEAMDTAAACRTYNILAGEGRNVVAALLVERAGAPE